MSLPDVHVQIAFDTDPLTRPGPSDWTRVDTPGEQDGLRALSTRRGAGLRDGAIVAGSASGVLGNQAGNLTPSNTAGDWYPDVTLRKRIRFLHEGTDELFTGYIDRIDVEWDKSQNDGTATITATDLFGILAQVELPPSVLHQTIVDLEPVAYWPLAETQGTFADDVVGTWDGTYRQPVTGGEAILPYDKDAKARVSAPSSSDPTGQSVRIGPLGASGTQTVSFWISQDAGSAPSGVSSVWVQSQIDPSPTGPGATSPRFWVGTSLTSVSVFIDDGSASAIGTVPFNMYGTHHVAVTVDTGLSSYLTTVYIDGSPREWFQSNPIAPVDPFAAVNISSALSGVAYTSLGYSITQTVLAGYAGVLADVAYWQSVLSADEISSIHAAGVDAWAGDTTGTRVDRILDAIGVDAADRDVASGVVPCGPTTLGGNALEYLRRLAATEGGAIFVSADGKITFTQQFANDPTPLDVIGDSGCPYSAITLDFSTDRTITAAEVTPENGVTHKFLNPTAVAALGPMSVQLDTMHATPSGAKSKAAEVVARNKALRTEVRNVTLEPRRSDTPTTVTVDAEIGDPFTVEYDTNGTGAESVLVRVEAISQRLTPSSWQTTLDVMQQTVLPDTVLDTAGQGLDESILAS